MIPASLSSMELYPRNTVYLARRDKLAEGGLNSVYNSMQSFS